jgi:adenylate cyclase
MGAETYSLSEPEVIRPVEPVPELSVDTSTPEPVPEAVITQAVEPEPIQKSVPEPEAEIANADGSIISLELTLEEDNAPSAPQRSAAPEPVPEINTPERDTVREIDEKTTSDIAPGLGPEFLILDAPEITGEAAIPSVTVPSGAETDEIGEAHTEPVPESSAAADEGTAALADIALRFGPEFLVFDEESGTGAALPARTAAADPEREPAALMALISTPEEETLPAVDAALPARVEAADPEPEPGALREIDEEPVALSDMALIPAPEEEAVDTALDSVSERSAPAVVPEVAVNLVRLPESLPEPEPLPDVQRSPFSLTAKLISAATILLVLSLASLVAMSLVSLGSAARAMTEEAGDSANRRAAVAVEMALRTAHADTAAFLALSSILPAEERAQMASFFFEQNPHISFVAVYRNLASERSFLSPSFSPSLVSSFIEANGDAIARAEAGETLLLNVDAAFGFPALAFFYQWEPGRAAVVILAPETVTQSMGEDGGESVSFLLDTDVQAGNGTDFRRHPLVQAALVQGESAEQRFHAHYTAADGSAYFGTLRKLGIAGTMVITETPDEGMRFNFWLVLGVVLGVSIAGMALFSKTLSDPLKDLIAATGALESGDYSLNNLVNKNRDETGVLTQSVLAMSRTLAPFAYLTNKTLARLARSGTLPLGGADRAATILSVHIRSFNELTRHLKANEMAEFITAYREQLTQAVIATGGAVDRFWGDTMIASWGVLASTGSPEQDAANCVSAALLMRAILHSFNYDRGGRRKPLIKIACGIDSGIVVAGHIESKEQAAWTVVGEAVAGAERSGTLNEVLGTETLLTEATAALCGSAFITEEMPSTAGRRLFALVNYPSDAESGAQSPLEIALQVPDTLPGTIRQCIGPAGPPNLAALRRLLR